MGGKSIEELLLEVASRSTSIKKKVGAVLVNEGKFISSGYNHDINFPTGNCENTVTLKTFDSVIHAEMDCIKNYEAQYGTNDDMSYLTMYITHEPCISCQAALLRKKCKWEVRKKMTEETVGQVLAKIDVTLKERGNAYGAFEGNALITQSIMEVLTDNAKRNLERFELEALHMIAHKMSRIVNGQQTKRDNWHDIAGYAKLAEDLTVDQ